MKKLSQAILSAFFGLLFAFTASHATAADKGIYLGAGVGVYTLDVDNTSFDDNSTVARVLGGIRITDNLAFEGEYQKLFESKDDIFGAEAKLEADAWTLSIRPILPLTDFLEIYGKVGYTFYEFESRATVLGVDITGEDSERDLIYGAGVDLNFSEGLALRGEVTRLDVDDADLNLVTAALVFKF